MNCDETFAFYLYTIAQKVKREFYLQVFQFILHFRDCVNKYCWEKKVESDEALATIEPSNGE